MLTQHQESTEKRQEKSDRKLDKLVETVTVLTQSHIESRKDREYDTARMERLDQNQRELGKEVSLIANQLLIVQERQKNSKSNYDRVANIGNSVILAAVLAYLGLK